MLRILNVYKLFGTQDKKGAPIEHKEFLVEIDDTDCA